jgi:hypothetical protein
LRLWCVVFSQSQQFVKFCRVCQIVGSSLSEARSPLVEADVVVAYTAEVKRRREGKSVRAAQKMDFSDFLTSLMKLSVKVYPNHARRSVDESFQRLLLRNVLPLADRRNPGYFDISVYETDTQILELREIFSDALEQIFQFYATGSDAKPSKSPSKTDTLARSSVSVMGHASNSMKNALSYGAFLRFAADFDLSNSVILSTLELGDIYLSSLKEIEPESHIRKLTFGEFWDALLRCALVAYSKISSAPPADKLKGLFLYMWRAINRSVPKAFSERRSVTTYAGDLIAGAMLFNRRFTALWHEDDYRDYLSPEAASEESGRAVLRRIMGSPSATAAEMAGSLRHMAGGFGSPSGEDLSGPSVAPGASEPPSEAVDYPTSPPVSSSPDHVRAFASAHSPPTRSYADPYSSERMEMPAAGAFHWDG